MLAIAGALIGPALVAPRTLAPVHRAWIALGDVLGAINTRIVLGLIFFVLITPWPWPCGCWGAIPCNEPSTRRPRRTSYGGSNDPPPTCTAAIQGELGKWQSSRRNCGCSCGSAESFGLLPIVIVLVLFGGLVVMTQGTAVAPFIYTLF